MKSDDAVYMISYFCSIMNTDSSYVDSFFCCEEWFEEKQRMTSQPDDSNERQYNEFRTVFGVVITFIVGWLMHYHIEITLAMPVDETGGYRLVDTGKFMFFDEKTLHQNNLRQQIELRAERYEVHNAV